MTKLIITLFLSFLLIPTLASAKEWHEVMVVEGQSENLYIGVSRYHSSLTDALSEAYNEAVKEAVKHNFGFNQTLQENFYSSINNTEVQQNSFLKLDNIQIRGIKPVNQKVIEKDNKFMVYRQISYNKNEINAEKKRLKEIASTPEIVNTYNQSGAIGYLKIITVPNEAQVLLTSEDGKTFINGQTNGNFNLPLGKYSVFISKKGFKPHKQTVIVADDKGELKINLTPATASLKIQTNPPDAQVFIDGRLINTFDVELLANKEYKILIEHPNYFPKEQTIQLQENYLKRLSIELDPRDSFISVFSSPDGADVYLDGYKIGTTPVIKYQVSAGQHRVSVEKSGYLMTSQSIYANPNITLNPIHIDLKNKEEIKRDTYNRETKELIKNTSKKNSYFLIDYISNSSLMDLSSMNLKHNLNGYKDNTSQGSMNFNYGRKIFEHTGIDFGFGYGVKNANVNEKSMLNGDYTENYLTLQFGLPIFVLWDRLRIIPNVQYYSFTHLSKEKNYNYIHNDREHEVNVSGFAKGLRVNLDILKFQMVSGTEVSISANYSFFQPFSNSVKVSLGESGYEIKPKTSQAFGIGLNFFWN